MSQIPISSSSLEFKTREYYVDGTDPNTAKGSTLTFEELDKTLLFLSQSIAENGSSFVGLTTASVDLNVIHFSKSNGTFFDITVDTGSGQTYYAGPGIIIDENNYISSSYTSSLPEDTSMPRAVGGINSGSTAGSFKGKTFSEMFDLLLFPVLSPVGTPGSFSSTVSPSAVREIGSTINVTLTSTFNKGTWVVAGQTPNRNYYGAATNFYFTSGSTLIDNGTTANYTFNNHKVISGPNNFPTAVSYSMGDQPIFSNGTPSGSAINSGSLSDLTNSFTGIYPYFYGSSSADTLSISDVITLIQSLYGPTPSTSTQKVVATSTGTITGYFYQPGDAPLWSWFAHPSTSTTKTVFYQNVSNTNAINSAGTFNNNGTADVVASGYWSSTTYRIYITNNKTAFLDAPAFTVELRNS